MNPSRAETPTKGNTVMKKLFVSIVGTRDWQTKHKAFDTISDFEDYCKLYNPSKKTLVDNYGTLKELCEGMSDCFVTFHYAWQK